MKNKEISKEEAFDIFINCQLYFNTYKTYSIPFRMEQLVKLKNAIQRYERSIMKALYKDLGKSGFEAYATEIGFTLKSITDTLKHLNNWTKEEPVKTPYYLLPAQSKLVYEPYGTVLIMAPYNYPFQLLIEPLIGAISAGNCVILKPSELTPWTSMVIQKMISEIFNPNYIRCIEGGVSTNQALLQVPFRYIFFTGSTTVGKLVMEAASKNLIPVTLELGGKSPVFIEQSANIKWAANRIAWGKFINVGQTCIAPDYVLVPSALKDIFIEELKKCIIRFYGSDASKSASYGRIINNRHFDRLMNIINKDSSYIRYGGAGNPLTKYLEPTILEIPDLNASCMQEEIFGPILPIISYQSMEEAKSIIETMPTPLALYLFTKNKRVRNDIVAHIPCGGVCINDTLEHIVNPNLSFGGIGSSGMGSYHGKQSFLTFSHQKSVLSRAGNIDMKFLNPPYTKAGLKVIKKILK
ncbi:aldehyde dehydrogenase [Lachnotalea glycerini]|nr:aldehyde dehydrogenase [Lachnotalea glycerini]